MDYDLEFIVKVLNYNKDRYNAFKYDLEFEENKEYEKVLSARRNKISRLKRRFLYLISRFDYIWFCTFTFDDDYISKCDRTKRDLMKSVLNTHDFKYILNVDYGDKTQREHYHCILATNWNIDINQYFQSCYPCFSKSICCKKGKDDFLRLSKYINKLVNHCLKATTKRRRILYNFRGYDNFCPTGYEKRIAYIRDFEKLFSVEDSLESEVALLDKGNVT